MNRTDAAMPGRGSKTRFLLYGAYGYTGRLTAELAAAKKLEWFSRAATKTRWQDWAIG